MELIAVNVLILIAGLVFGVHIGSHVHQQTFKSLAEAGEEITALNKEANKYSNELARLRAAFREHGKMTGASSAEVEDFLKNMAKG